jgi:hypothetical protein
MNFIRNALACFKSSVSKLSVNHRKIGREDRGPAVSRSRHIGAELIAARGTRDFACWVYMIMNSRPDRGQHSQPIAQRDSLRPPVGGFVENRRSMCDSRHSFPCFTLTT